MVQKIACGAVGQPLLAQLLGPVLELLHRNLALELAGDCSMQLAPVPQPTFRILRNVIAPAFLGILRIDCLVRVQDFLNNWFCRFVSIVFWPLCRFLLCITLSLSFFTLETRKTTSLGHNYAYLAALHQVLPFKRLIRRKEIKQTFNRQPVRLPALPSSARSGDHPADHHLIV